VYMGEENCVEAVERKGNNIVLVRMGLKSLVAHLDMAVYILVSPIYGDTK